MTAKTLDQLHEDGARRFGWDWLRANELVIAACREQDYEPGDQPIRMRAVLSAIAYAICERDALVAERARQDAAGDALDRGE